jgi:hypothetical protein
MIKPEKYYSASYIIRNNFIPWMGSIPPFIHLLETKRGQEVYKPIIKTTKKVTRYLIKGSTLLEILKQAESGKLRT